MSCSSPDFALPVEASSPASRQEQTRPAAGSEEAPGSIAGSGFHSPPSQLTSDQILQSPSISSLSNPSPTLHESPLLPSFAVLPDIEVTAAAVKRNVSVELIPTKGHGLIALAPLNRGTLIIAEPALITFTNDTLSTSSERSLALCSSLAELSTPKQEAFWALFNAFPTTITGESQPQTASQVRSVPNARGILQSNCFPLSTTGLEVLGVFETISRANHSCVPNAVFSFFLDEDNDQSEGIGRLYAVKDIESGQEVVIDYAHNVSFSDRGRWLSEAFGFECSCEGCTSVTNGKTLEVFEELESRIMALKGERGTMELIRDALDVLEELGIEDMRVTRIHEYGLQNTIHLGELNDALIFAELYWRGCVACLGSDHVDSKEAEETLLDLMKI